MFILAGLIASLLFTKETYADPESDRIDRVKAAFVINIARFVSWPSAAFEADNNHLMLCLYKSNPLHEAVESINGKSVTGRRAQIVKINSLAESRFCNILLIGENELQWFNDEISNNGPLAQPMLTVADLTGFDAAENAIPGIMVRLVRKEVHISFAIDLHQSRQAGLEMSSKLLKLAEIIDKDD